MNLKQDKRIIMTLDAGGTNFVFSAIQAAEEVIESITLPASADSLSELLKRIIEGFEQVRSKLATPPVAISLPFRALRIMKMELSAIWPTYRF